MASSELSRSPNRWASWSMRRVRSSGGAQQLARGRDRLGRQLADIARHLARLDLGMARRDHGVDEAGALRLRGSNSASHHQHGEGALVAHRARHQEAGGADRHEPEMDVGRGEGRGFRPAHSRNGTASRCPCRSRAVDGRDDRLGVVGERIEEFGAVRQRLGVATVSACMKSSISLPAVNTPEPPVMIMQRMSGLFCAVSIARLISRYMSCVIAFFLLGRRRVIDARSALFGDDDIAIRHESTPAAAATPAIGKSATSLSLHHLGRRANPRARPFRASP